MLGIKTTHRLRAVGHVVPQCALILESSVTTSLRIQLAKCPDFRNFCQEETRLFFFSVLHEWGQVWDFLILRSVEQRDDRNTICRCVYKQRCSCFIYIFPDTVTASLHCLLRSISKTRNETYLVWLFPISCQALIRPVSNYVLKLLTLEK